MYKYLLQSFFFTAISVSRQCDLVEPAGAVTGSYKVLVRQTH